jgi:elongator complex protein 1
VGAGGCPTLTLALTQTLIDDLNSKKRYAEAATVLLDYAGDVRQAVIAYVEGNLFADARRVVSSPFSLAEEIMKIVFLLGLSACRAGTDGRDRSPWRTRNQIATGRRSGRNEISALEADSSCSGAQGQKGRTARYGLFFFSSERELTAEFDVCVCVFADVFYGNDDVDLHNIDVMTDVSMAPTAFTRYTAAPSTASKKSR